MANLGLSVSDVVNVQILMSPTAAAQRNFGSLLILGDSSVIDTTERLRLYTSVSAIAADFGSTAPEYLAASLFFGQSPQPQQCYVGRWAPAGSHGLLRGAVLGTSAQAIANFTSITSGGMTLSVDGTPRALTGLNFSAQTNLNGVASVVQTALSAYATVTWDANNARFVVKSLTTGISSAVSFATAPGSGTDVSTLLGLSASAGGYVSAGIAAETLLTAATILANQSNNWYGLQVAATQTPADADYTAVSGFIEAASVSRIFGITTQNAAALDATQTTDLSSVLMGLGYKRTFIQYSSSNAYASASIFGRAFTVDFTGQNTTITLKFKTEPGVSPEYLTESQAAALAAKNCNAYVEYNNSTAILQQGTMVNGYFFDEVHGTDWLQNALQTAVYNLLYTSTTKIPQTDAGVNRIVVTVTQELEQAVTNGLVAPGVWNGPDLGALSSGDTLSKGYYVYAPQVASQSQADREARKAPTLQAAIKLAGAVHSANVLVSVNR